MPVEALRRDNLSPPVQSAEIEALQPFKEVILSPSVSLNSLLEKTGFNTRKEMTRLVAYRNQNVKEGKDCLEALILSAGETEVNIRTFIVEYIQTKTILPHLNRFAEVEGRVRMVGQSGVSVLAGITADERNGSVLEASVAVEDFLTAGGSARSRNKIAVINSPLGHSGLISQQGKVVRYKSNQTMVFWTDEEGELHGLTIVSDLNKKQSRQLSIDLGIDEAYLGGDTEAEQVANIVANPALFSYGKSITNPAKYVLEEILAIRGSADFRLEQEDGSVEERSVAKTREDIEKVESLLKFKPFWEQCLAKLRMIILAKGSKLGNALAQSEIAKAIEEAILEITIDYLQQIKSKKFNVFPDNVIYFKPVRPPMDKYAVAAAFLRTRSGCAGGGGKSGISSLSGVSLGSSVVGLSSVFGFGGESSKKGKACISCGEVNYCTKDCYKCGGMLI